MSIRTAGIEMIPSIQRQLSGSAPIVFCTVALEKKTKKMPMVIISWYMATMPPRMCVGEISER